MFSLCPRSREYRTQVWQWVSALASVWASEVWESAN
jgi:hypothetical protein